MRCGGTPEPVQAPPLVVFDEVTNGYVPWSMSRNVPCAPSNKISRFAFSASCKNIVVFATNGFNFFPAPRAASLISWNETGFAPSSFNSALFSLTRAASFSEKTSGCIRSITRRPERFALSA